MRRSTRRAATCRRRSRRARTDTAQIELPLQSVVTRQIRLQGSCASAGEYPACIALLSSGAIKVDSMISARTGLDEAASWFDRLYNREPDLMKVIVHP